MTKEKLSLKEELKKINLGIGLFIVILLIGVIINLFSLLVMFTQPYTLLRLLLSLIGYVGFIALLIYTAKSLYSLKSNAIFLAKITIVLSGVSAVIQAIIFSYVYSQFTSVLLPILVWGAWFYYFSKSKKIEEKFPIENRKVDKLDMIIATVGLAGLIISFLSVFV